MSKNIIFVLLDGARCDRLDESSDFRKLKKLGCLFDNIIAAYPYTFPAINSMFTGLFGKENGVDAYYKMFRLKKDVQVLPEILQQNGYFTSCDLISDKVISPRGFDIHQSHDEYNDDLVERHSDLILKSFQKSGGKPIFTFLQFSHIHMITVSEVLKEFEWNDEEFYKMKKENMSNFDLAFKHSAKYAKEILNLIKKTNKLNDTIIIFFSDHGTGVGERFGERNYGVFTYEETIRTFHLVIGQDIMKDHVCKKLISSIQIFPTILDLAGIKHKSKLISLEPYLKGNFEHGIENKHVFSETGGLQGPFPSPDKPNVFCIKTPKYKLMYFKTPNEWSMFDLENDPLEKNNIYGKITDIQELLKEQLLSWINR